MKRILQLSFLFLATLLYFSCEPSEEGCLDIFSDNYDFDAITSCDSCCTYPSATFQFKLVYGDTSFLINKDTFLLSTDDSFSITKLEIVFSDFEFIGDADTYIVRDTIRNNANTIKNDFAFFKTAQSRTIGKTRFEDTIRTVNFRVGFNQTEVEKLLPFSTLDQTSHLDEALDSLYMTDTESYLASCININMRDSIRAITLNDPVENNTLSFDVNIPVQAGISWGLICNLDVELLVSQLTPVMTNDEIESEFRAALTSALSLE